MLLAQAVTKAAAGLDFFISQTPDNQAYIFSEIIVSPMPLRVLRYVFLKETNCLSRYFPRLNIFAKKERIN